jgi:D-ribose pyranose/furanose isomerase RbsD
MSNYHTDTILQSIHSVNADLSSEHLMLNNKISDGHSGLAQDICASTAQISNTVGQLKSDVYSSTQQLSGQHAQLQDRISSIGEKGLVATFQTGKEILSDMSSTTRHLGAIISDVNKDVLKSGCDTTHAVLTSNRDIGLNIRDAIDKSETAITKNVVDAHLATERVSAESRLTGAVLSGELRSTNAQTVSDLRSAIHGVDMSVMTSARALDSSIHGAESAIKEKICDTAHSVALSRCILERQNADNAAAFDRQICDTKHAVLDSRCVLERQAADNRACLDRQILETKHSVERQAAENKASIELEACKATHALSRQMSDCCCELKEKVESRFCDTAQLIRELDTGRIRDKLASTEQENLFLRMQSQFGARSSCCSGGGNSGNGNGGGPR